MSFYQPIAPAGSNTQIQYNKNGGFGGDADLTWDDTGKELGVGGDINLDDGGTYSTTLQMVTATANRTISFPDATGTVALVAGSSGQVTYNNAGAQAGLTSASIGSTDEINISLAGAASTPPVSFTGSWFTGGTSTTTKPQLLIEPTGTTSTAWSTSGTGLGVNAASGFSGRLLDLQTNGTSRMVVQGDGKLGLGISSPADLLHIAGTGSDLVGLRIVNTLHNASVSSTSQQKFGITNSLGERNVRIQAREENVNSNSVALDFFTNSAAVADGETVKMTIKGDGKVGIGSTTPEDKLEIAGAGAGIILASPDGTRYRLTVANGGTLSIAAV